MREVPLENLEDIVGGSSTISGTVINAFTNIVRLLYEVGQGLGSAIRRVGSDGLCPLK